MEPSEQLLCHSWFTSRALQHGQNCSLLCVHTGLWCGWDNMFLEIISLGGTQSPFSGDFCSHECISEQTHRTQEWNATPAKWLLLNNVVNMGFSLWLDLLELNNWTQDQRRCIWALPVGTLGLHHIICWLSLCHAPWWRSAGHSKTDVADLKESFQVVPYPRKWGEVKGSILPNAYFPMAVHIFDVLCLRTGQQYEVIWELWDLCPPQKAVDCPLPSIAGTARSVSYHSAPGFSTFSPCPSKGMLLSGLDRKPIHALQKAPFCSVHKPP